MVWHFFLPLSLSHTPSLSSSVAKGCSRAKVSLTKVSLLWCGDASIHPHPFIRLHPLPRAPCDLLFPALLDCPLEWRFKLKVTQVVAFDEGTSSEFHSSCGSLSLLLLLCLDVSMWCIPLEVRMSLNVRYQEWITLPRDPMSSPCRRLGLSGSGLCWNSWSK